MLVDIHVPRADVVKLARGMTLAKLANVMMRLSTLDLTFAQAKLRARRTPANQAHVTNAKDDPVQLAADAATASAIGFDEIETTMRVAETPGRMHWPAPSARRSGKAARSFNARSKRPKNCDWASRG